MIVTCPKCAAALNVREGLIGKRLRCSKCGDTFGPLADSHHPTPAPRIFVSHSHQDRKFVEETIKPFLEEHGLRPWWSGEDIRTGGEWEPAIHSALANSDWLMVVMSPRAEKSEWVQREVEWAFEKMSRRILPVLLEPCDIKQINKRLWNLHYANFHLHGVRAKRSLLASMVRQLNREKVEADSRIEKLHNSLEALRDENSELLVEKKQTDALIDNSLAYNGNWSEPIQGEIPEFWPLADRQAPIVAVLNLKGGVGKTTVTANLGATLWGPSFRKSVLLLDLDYQASLSIACLDPAKISRLRDKERLAQQLFLSPEGDAKMILQCAQEVTDRHSKNHEGQIVAADENLALAEMKALFRWLMRRGKIDDRFLLRSMLHSELIGKNYDIVLMDCPPRLTTATINALFAADFILVPTLPDKLSTEAVPRILRWIRERRREFFPSLNLLGIVINKSKQRTLVGREKEELAELEQDCRDAWGEPVAVFKNFIPTFTEVSLSYGFPAHSPALRDTFSKLWKEMEKKIQSTKPALI